MKTRLDVLFEMHDAGLTELVDNEILLKVSIRRQIAMIKPDDRDKMDAFVEETKRKVLQLEGNLKIVEEMIDEEKKKG